MKLGLYGLLMAAMVAACGQNSRAVESSQTPASTNISSENLPMTASELSSAEHALSAFVEFVRDRLPQTDGMEDDKLFAASLVTDPVQPGTTVAASGAEVKKLLESSFGTDFIAANLLYGDVDHVVADDRCWVVRYESLMMGGVAGCVSGDPAQVVLVWLLHEG